MLCERCNKKKASVFYRENINGKARAFHLCGECAAAMQQAGELEDLSSAFAHFPSLSRGEEEGFFGELCSLPTSKRPTSLIGASSVKKCPLCGASFGNIASTGKVGCATCYQAFAEELSLPLRAAHGRTRHVGQSSRRFRAKQERTRRLAELKEQLKKAITEENFEEAATLRDRIRATEGEA